MPEAELEFRDVSIRFGKTIAAENLRLEVSKGEFIAVLGPSGSGKSTLLRMLGGQMVPDSGDIRIGGESIVGCAPNQIDCATVFQDFALFPHMNVRQNVEFGLKMRGWSREDRQARAMEVLGLVDMDAFAERPIVALSGGEKQRVATARALAIRPRVLLMDEPLSALDRLIRLRVQREISNLLHELDVTTIYVTHDQREALTMADRVAVLHRGRLEQIAPPLDLISRPATSFVADFLGGSGNLFTGKVAGQADEDGMVPVETGLGRILARKGVGATANGQQVSVLVRPEDFSLEPVAGDYRVDDVAFTGEVAEISVGGPAGNFTVKQLGISRLSTGDQVGLGVPDGAAVLITEGEQ
ncbi:MAG: ABC transporter ATP-binding protein [Solirubrobacterales bacterium]|nr:ABC transporter ATP-binding protein [Solirubrobacterales bacterium]OJU93252.1 MAG: hypothetical protein BGO23_11200 [Solirubrobacterales bacterium 67-14]